MLLPVLGAVGEGARIVVSLDGMSDLATAVNLARVNHVLGVVDDSNYTLFAGNILDLEGPRCGCNLGFCMGVFFGYPGFVHVPAPPTTARFTTRGPTNRTAWYAHCER
jgi:hypothetical protein